MTRIQELRNHVALLKRQVIEEADGSFTEAWEEGDSVWAQVVPYGERAGRGGEAFGEGWNTLNSVQTVYKVTMRYRRERFARIRYEDITLALLRPPLMDGHRQWMMCVMYVVGENDG